jgi:two-component system, OmpR family, phosphate regulon response regulator PhoB
MPDLVILDWMTPGKTGIEVARELRADPHTARIAILMLSAMGQEQDRKQGLAAGVQAYLVKPFSPLELLERVQEVLRVAEFCRGESDGSSGYGHRKTA